MDEYSFFLNKKNNNGKEEHSTKKNDLAKTRN